MPYRSCIPVLAAVALLTLPLAVRAQTQVDSDNYWKPVVPHLPDVANTPPWVEKPGKEMVLKFAFAEAAHFPYLEFGARQEPIETQALVIFEGMSFRADAEGNYEVCFNAATPDIPVTVRLQLQVFSSPLRPPITLTLPPIPIATDLIVKGNYRGRIVLVRHRGYSPFLQCLLHDGCPQIVVTRQGTARFGVLPLAE